MILDTDILIELLRGRPEAESWLQRLDVPPAISGMAALEVLFGARDAAEQRKVDAYLGAFRIIWPLEEDALAARSYAKYRLSHGMELIDALTAAVAVRTQFPLVTFNVKHFRAIPNLVITQPYAR